jgi:peptidoglycan/LPS O-acetylase OafA/YrhL
VLRLPDIGTAVNRSWTPRWSLLRRNGHTHRRDQGARRGNGHVASKRERRSGGLRHRDDIQGLRAVAVLLVVANHAGVSFLKGGYVGVDVFFVLSGFLITGLLLSQATKPRLGSLVDFYSRRARRILPAAALTLVVTDVVAYRLLNVVRAKQVLQDSIFASLFTANVHFASQGTDYFAQSQPPSPVQHFWSLAVEEQFYLVWPLLLSIVLFGLAMRRRARRAHPASAPAITQRGHRRLLPAVILIGGSSLAWSVYDTHTHPTAAYFSTFARAWELALGAALAIGATWLARVPTGWRAAAGWLGMIAVFVAAVTFSDSTPFPGLAALLPTVGAALVVAAGIGERHARLAVGKPLSAAPFRFVGDRSYALYLWHWPVLIIAVQYAGHDLSPAVKLLLLLGAFLLSVVSYAVFENPLRRARWSSPRKALVLWPASVAAVMLVAAWGINAVNVDTTHLADAGAPEYPGYVAAGQSGDAGSDSSQQAALALGSASTSGALPAVVASVRNGGARIPAGLIPPVATLLDAEYRYPDGCTTPEGQTSGPVCRLGVASSPRSIVAVGDSHAQMWMPAILGIAHNLRWAVLPLTKSGCIPPKWMGSQATGECSGWYRWVLQEITRLHPTVTLIGADPGSLGVTAMMALAQASKRVSGKVVLIDDPPGQSQQPVDCLLSSGATMASCSYTPSQDRVSLSQEIASAAHALGVGMIATWGWFCYQNVCPMVIDHTIAYLDRGHVTAAYATELVSAFGVAFQHALGESQ